MRYLSVVITIVLIFVGCSNEPTSAPENTSTSSIELTVYSMSGWSAENPHYSIVPEAEVAFYSESSFDLGDPVQKKRTNTEGKVKFFHNEVDAECFIVSTDKETSVINNYLINGVFESQEDMDASPYQEGAQIGGIKYRDINADGIINEKDQVPCQNFNFEFDETIKVDVLIGAAHD